MEIPISYNKCKYCGSGVILIDDFGECPKGCPGYMKTIFEQKCRIPDKITESLQEKNKGGFTTTGPYFLEGKRWIDMK